MPTSHLVKEGRVRVTGGGRVRSISHLIRNRFRLGLGGGPVIHARAALLFYDDVWGIGIGML